MNDDAGKPCSNITTGALAGPASRDEKQCNAVDLDSPRAWRQLDNQDQRMDGTRQADGQNGDDPSFTISPGA